MLVTQEQLDTQICELRRWGLDRSTAEALDKSCVYTVGDLAGLKSKDLLLMRNISQPRVDMVVAALVKFFRGDEPQEIYGESAPGSDYLPSPETIEQEKFRMNVANQFAHGKRRNGPDGDLPRVGACVGRVHGAVGLGPRGRTAM